MNTAEEDKLQAEQESKLDAAREQRYEGEEQPGAEVITSNEEGTEQTLSVEAQNKAELLKKPSQTPETLGDNSLAVPKNGPKLTTAESNKLKPESKKPDDDKDRNKFDIMQLDTSSVESAIKSVFEKIFGEKKTKDRYNMVKELLEEKRKSKAEKIELAPVDSSNSNKNAETGQEPLPHEGQAEPINGPYGPTNNVATNEGQAQSSLLQDFHAQQQTPGQILQVDGAKVTKPDVSGAASLDEKRAKSDQVNVTVDAAISPESAQPQSQKQPNLELEQQRNKNTGFRP